VSRDWHWLVPAAAIAFVGCQNDRLPSEPEPTLEGQFSTSPQAAGVGADDWIVVFKDGTQDPPGLAHRLVAANGGSIRFTYSHAIKGFAGNLPPQAIEAIQKNPNVAYVERDGVMTTTAVGSWGLDRIDERDLVLDGVYDPGAGRNGSGVTAYIIDTGVELGLGEFGDRASSGYDFVDDEADASDCHGHGTHVAGTVGSATYGVAKNVSLVAVRVLNCQGSGSYSGVIAGINWVTANQAALSVANMSLGGGFSQAVNDAVNASVTSGVVYAVSSGNSNTDACGQSPASAEKAITVNSSTSSDARSSFSNYGNCTDIFAPGSSITSTTMNGGTASWSGTSMASPHVAGVAALYLQDGTSADDVPAAMAARATRDKISNPGSGSPNLLLYVGTDSGDPCVIDGCPDAAVQWVSDVTVKTNRGKNGSGTVTVQVVEPGATPVPLSGVTVNGSWTVDGNTDFTSSSGVTDADGMVELGTGGIRFAETFEFCVTGLTGSVVDVTGSSRCNGFGSPLDGGTVTPPPPAGAPSGLVVTNEQRGRNWRANLAWQEGAATVDVYLGAERIASGISNDHSYTDNLGKNAAGTFTYTVCNADTSECSLPGETTI
jgi:subtilisin family serine protease